MRTNRVPFSDVCSLIAKEETTDNDGYASEKETKTEVYCSISDGVTRSEMYEALKAGLKLSGTAEIWEDDYNKQEVLDHNGTRFKIVRVYPTGHGTIELTLKEEIR